MSQKYWEIPQHFPVLRDFPKKTEIPQNRFLRLFCVETFPCWGVSIALKISTPFLTFLIPFVSINAEFWQLKSSEFSKPPQCRGNFFLYNLYKNIERTIKMNLNTQSVGPAFLENQLMSQKITWKKVYFRQITFLLRVLGYCCQRNVA